MKRGDIYWADLDPTIGSEISKKRPVIIVSNDINNEYSGCVTILPITSSTKQIYPFEVFVTAIESNLEYDSKIKANQIRTIDKKRLTVWISHLSDKIMKDINKSIKIHLEIL